MNKPPEIVAENLADQFCGDHARGTKPWQDVKSSFLAGYIECLNNWKWKGVGNDGYERDNKPGGDDRKVIPLESARTRNR